MTNAVSKTGALGVMQLVKTNYYNKDLNIRINPFDPEQAIPRGVEMLSGLINEYGTDSVGIEKSLAAYNQGREEVNWAIANSISMQDSNNWKNYLERDSEQAKKYITNINSIRNGNDNIPGYFGVSR